VATATEAAVVGNELFFRALLLHMPTAALSHPYVFTTADGMQSKINPHDTEAASLPNQLALYTGLLVYL
jgi:hypothetical protein